MVHAQEAGAAASDEGLEEAALRHRFKKRFLSSIPAPSTPPPIPCLLRAVSLQECKPPVPKPASQFQGSTKAWVGWRAGENEGRGLSEAECQPQTTSFSA